MPSGHKKRKFLKQKNKLSVPPPYQGNGTKGKEKHDIPEKEEVGNEDREKDSVFEFKGGDTSGNEGSRVSTIATAGIPSEAENSQKFNVLKMIESDKSADELLETEKSQLFESNEFSEESVTSDTKVGWTGELEEKGSEDKDMKEVEMDNSLKEVITPQVKEYVPLTEQGEAGQAAAQKEEVIFAHEVYVSACEKEDKVMIDAHGSMEAPQDCERDAIMPKIEISHPPLIVRRASVWNCCGLLEILISSERPTFRRITRNRSTEQFSGLPYVYSLLNCLICFWYGLPCVSYGVFLLATVNSIGAIFQLLYIALFITFGDKAKRLKICGLLIGVFAVFGLIIYVSLEMFDHLSRQTFIGYLSVASLISMFASPLFIINLVVRTKSVEFMPFHLSLATFLMSISFFAYGLLLHDFFIYFPNGIGSVLGVTQLLVYVYYSRRSREEPTLPLLLS